MPDFAWLANSRTVLACAPSHSDSLGDALALANAAPARTDTLPPWAETEALRDCDIVIDATASEAVADWHAELL